MQDSRKRSGFAALFVLLIWGAGSPGHADVLLPQLPESEQQPVHSLEVAGDALWVLGNRDLYRVEKGGEPKIVKTAVRATAVVPFEERVYFGTKRSGLYRFGDENTAERENPPAITALAVFNKTIWIGAETGLFTLDHWDPIYRLRVTDLKVIGSDLWIASHQGAFKISGTTDSSSPPALATDLEPILFEDETAPPIKSIEQIDREVWLATLDKDLRFGWAGQPYRVTGDRAVALKDTEGWRGDSVWATTDGAVFATKNGFGIIDENDAGNFTSFEEPIRLIFEWDGFTWIGTTKGLYRTKELSQRPERSPVGGLLEAYDFEIFDGTVWLATEQGLFKLENDLQLSGRVRGLPLKLTPAELVVEYSGRSERDLDRLPSSVTVRTGNSTSSENDENKSEATYDPSSGLIRFPASLDFGFDTTSLTLSDEFGNSSETFEYKVLNLPRLWTWSFVIGFILLTLRLALLSRKKKVEIAENHR